VDLDAVWSGEWGRSRDGCIRRGWFSSKGQGRFVINLERPIITNGNFFHFVVRERRTLRKLLREGLFNFILHVQTALAALR